jgi:predicted MFS family arabinose efflux permease
LLPSALTLNGMTVSVARAVGPGLAGLLLALWGAGSMFLLNVLAFVGLFVVIVRWKNRPPKLAADARFKAALIDGLRFAVRELPVRRLLLKGACNFFAVSIVLALIPAVVEGRLDGRPQTLGLLLACFGIGSVVGSFTLGRLYASLSRSRVIDLANVTHGIAVLILALSDNIYMSAGAMLLAGLSWTSIMTSVNIVAQMLLPAAYRARGLAANIMAMMGSLTLGAAVWGKVAEQYGLQQAFLAAGVMGVLMPLLTARLRLVEQLDEPVSPAAAPATADAAAGKMPP